MIDLLLLQLSNLTAPAGIEAILSSEGGMASGTLGFIVLGIILLPVFLLTGISLIEFPKRTRIMELFLGAFVLLVGALVFGFAAIGAVLKLVIPQ